MLGVVNLDKPVGPTSHDMVALVRRLTRMRRVGHAGTLDPLASGVLPILVGAATRLSEELTGGTKAYEAVVRLGWRSASDDAEGPFSRGGAPPSLDEVDAALSLFTGTFLQRPPRFSARKLHGRPAYWAARQGRPAELPARSVRVDALQLRSAESAEGRLDLHLYVRCAAGTYVRSLARDIGERLGCGGYLASLRRTAAAGLRVEDGVSPQALESLALEGRLHEAVLPLESVLTLPTVDLDPAAAAAFGHGLTVAAGTSVSAGRYQVRAAGELLGLGEVADGRIQPVKVLLAANR